MRKALHDWAVAILTVITLVVIIVRYPIIFIVVGCGLSGLVFLAASRKANR